MSLDNILLIPGVDWTPRNLFRPGDNGLWQDMSNFGTLRQLSTGSTLVSSVGDPIGYIADSGPRGHLTTQTTNGKRPILSRTPEGGVRQLLQWSEDVSNAYWAKTNLTPTTAESLSVTSGINVSTPFAGLFTAGISIRLVSSLFTVSNVAYTYTVEVKLSGFSHVQLRSSDGASLSGSGDIGTIIKMSDGSTASSSATSVTSTLLSDGWVRISMVHTPAAGNRYFGLWLWNSTSRTTDGTETLEVRNQQLELGDTATNYQKATTRYNITEAGKRDCWAYGTDGIDDAMSTPSSVDMSGSDEMTVCVGIRKLSDASSGLAVETSVSAPINTGVISLFCPPTSGKYLFRSKGSSDSTVNATDASFDAPTSNVLTGVGKISGDLNQLRIDGSLEVSSAADQGTGNFGNYRIYFGARAETSLFLSGLVYQEVIINRRLTDYELSKLEQYVAKKMGITL